jgi:hypothetical protein
MSATVTMASVDVMTQICFMSLRVAQASTVNVTVTSIFEFALALAILPYVT